MQKGWNPFKKRVILRITKKYDNKMTKALQKGDVILHRAMPGSFTSSLIREFTDSPYAHAEIYVGDGWSISAGPYGLTLSDELMYNNFVDVMRDLELTDQQRKIIVGKAYQSLAKPYEYFLLLSFPWIKGKKAVKRAANEAYICSENTAWCYKEAGIDLVPNRVESIEAPADLGHSKKLSYVNSWYKGELVTDAKRNKIHPIQGEVGKFAKFIINKLVDPITIRDEYYKELAKSQSLLGFKK